MRISTLPAAAAVLTLLSSSPVLAGPTVVNCAPGQRAVVQQERVRGERVTTVACVGGASHSSRHRYQRRRPSAASTALVIGGSAATGAGIGGIINGGKGAAIGAAIGGGVASLVSGAHR